MALLSALFAVLLPPRDAVAQAPKNMEPGGSDAAAGAATTDAGTPEAHPEPAAPAMAIAASDTVISEKREVPDYTRKAEEPTTAGDVLIWVPRILVSPIYFTTEYLLRRPIGWALSGIERNRIIQKSLFFITFGGNKNIGLVPTFFADFGLLPSVGGYFFWDNALAPHNHVRVHAGTWGPQWLSVSAADRYDVGRDSTVEIRGSWSRRADFPYFGLGPDSKQSLESRYAARTLDVGPLASLRLSDHVMVTTAAGVRRTTFEGGTCCTDPSVEERVTAGQLPLPPRFSDGYTIGYQNLSIAFDTRKKRQTGLRVVLDGQPAFDVSHTPGNSWVNYGATVGGFWDITGKARVVGLTVATLFSDPITGSGSEIPFNELVTLGGTGFMRGFLPGRLIDRSAAVATLTYQWPIWVFLDGTMHLAAGNVFGRGLEGIEARKMRLSTGIGLRTNSSPDHQFELLLGFGTDTFDNGAKIQSFRLALGTTRGF